MSWSLFFLGTSSGCPTRERNVSSYGIRFENGRILLVDCGEGTQQQLQRFNEKIENVHVQLKAQLIDTILITHLHGDHCYGLPGILASMSLGGRVSPLVLFGPPGIKEFIETIIRLSHLYLTYPVTITEIDADSVANKLTIDSTSPFVIQSYPLEHKVTSIGYLLTEHDLPGRFSQQKATELGITDKKDFGKLAKGISVVSPVSGEIIDPSRVHEEDRRGRKLLLLGDTCNSSHCVPDAMGADMIVHESTLEKSMKRIAIQNGHSTSEMAGLFANEVLAKNLVLTHFSPRYSDVDLLRSEAQQMCPMTNVLLAQDLCHFILPRK